MDDPHVYTQDFGNCQRLFQPRALGAGGNVPLVTVGLGWLRQFLIYRKEKTFQMFVTSMMAFYVPTPKTVIKGSGHYW